MGRTPVLTTFRTGDEVQDRNFDHIKQTLNPVLRNPLLNAADFRWTEIAPSSASGVPTFALQYRTPSTTTWTTITSFTSAGQIVQPAWIAPTFQNSWVNFGGGTMPAGYMKDTSGRVWGRGLVSTGSATNTVVYTLPAGYRPAAQVNLSTVSNSAFGKVKIDTNGNVTAEIGSTVWFAVEFAFDTR